MDKIVILQSEDDCIFYEKKFFSKNDLFLPIGPEAMYFCEVNNLNRVSLSELYEFDEHTMEKNRTDSLIFNCIEELNKFSREIDMEIALEIGNYFGFQLQIILGQVIHNVFIARKILSRFIGYKILIFKNTKNNLFMQYRPDPKSLLSEIFLNIKKNTKASIDIIELNRIYKTNSIKEKIILFFPNFALYLIRLIKDSLIMKNNYIGKTKKLRLGLIGGTYEWEKWYSKKEIREEFIVSLHRTYVTNSNNIFSNKISQIVDNNLGEASNLYKLDTLINMMSFHLSYFIENFYKDKKKIKKYDALIGSVICNPEDHYFSHIANKMNIPVILWQHGEKGAYSDNLELYTEFMYATHYFTYGNQVTNELIHWEGKRYFKKFFTVGTLHKNIIWNDIASKKIVYASGKWVLTASGFMDFQDPDARTFKSHLQILDFLNNKIKWTTVFKANNSPGLNEIPYKSRYKNIKFDFKTPFTKVLSNAEIVILDTPATTLIEACSTNVAIFVLAGRKIYKKKFLEVIKKRVTWCENVDILIEKLSDYMINKNYEANVKNQSYRKLYASHENNNKTDYLVEKNIKDIIKSSHHI